METLRVGQRLPELQGVGRLTAEDALTIVKEVRE